MPHPHITNAESFFESFANSACEMPDYDSLTECFQGVWQGFYVEILDINDQGFFLLSIATHDCDDANISDTHPRNIPTTGMSLYRFDTLAETLDVLAMFQRCTVSDSCNNTITA